MSDHFAPIIGNVEEPQLVKDLKSLHEAGDLYLPEKDTWPKRFTDSYPETQFVGSGSYSIVIVDPVDKERVIAFKYRNGGLESRLELLEKYHMHNVLHILFPEHFPKIYTASQKTGQMRKERVFPNEDQMKLHHALRIGEYQLLYRQIEADVYLKSGIHICLDDYENGNLIYDTQGNLKYIDLIDNSIDQFNYDMDKILNYFEKVNGSASDRKLLVRSLRRIRELDIINEYRTYGRINNSKWEKLSVKQQSRLRYVIRGL